jgi:cardiolipin synthase A/B
MKRTALTPQMVTGQPAGKSAGAGTGNQPPQKKRRRRESARRKPRAIALWLSLRHLVWLGWLWVFGQAAKGSPKMWGIVAVLVLLTILAFLFTPTEDSPEYGLKHEFAIESEEFLPSITGVTDTPFLPGNKIEIFNNGDEFYPVMLKAIEQAKQSITIEAYIYWAGETGRLFAQTLANKARTGIPVKILLDAVGSATISDEIMDILKQGGCQVEWYHPVFWYTINRINNRTHRKSLIIDGRIGFTGGAGIADHWLGHAQDPQHWRDIQIRIEGPAVAPLQTAFIRNWLETTGEIVSGPEFFPPIEPSGKMAVQSILSSPETGSSTVRLLYYLSIVCARKSIFIANPYFIPDEQAIQILTSAKRRGVDVKIMVSGVHNDNLLARRNSTRLYGSLLAAGVEIYEYNQTMLHHKYMVCDGIWSTVGTTNFDNRSFALNDENNVCVYDREFAAQWEQIFHRDLPRCQKIELPQWQRRGLFVKASELVAALLKSQV